MLPELFQVGPFPARSFGVALILGFVLAIFIARKRAARFGINPNKVWDLSFWVLIVGILGARILFILQDLPYYLKHTDRLLTLQFEGLTSFGGIISGFIVIALWSRRNKLSMAAVLDMFAVPFLVAHAVGRLGCLLNGCCYGGPTDSFLGVHFADVSGLHHPAQVYDAMMSLSGAWLLSTIERRRVMERGQSFALMLVIYGVSRFIFEFWRAGASSTLWGRLPITQAQAMALVLVISGAVGFVVIGRRGRHQVEAQASG